MDTTENLKEMVNQKVLQKTDAANDEFNNAARYKQTMEKADSCNNRLRSRQKSASMRLNIYIEGSEHLDITNGNLGDGELKTLLEQVTSLISAIAYSGMKDSINKFNKSLED